MTSNVHMVQGVSPPSTLPDAVLISVGVDVISLARLAKVLRRRPLFFQRLCHPDEPLEQVSDEGEGLLWAGALWTRKEAVAKCLQTGVWRAGVDWPDLGVFSFDARSFEAPSLASLSGAASALVPQGAQAWTWSEVTPPMAQAPSPVIERSIMSLSVLWASPS
jgi:phosphopantetheinyl transferase (holo-ACP synthase)